MIEDEKLLELKSLMDQLGDDTVDKINENLRLKRSTLIGFCWDVAFSLRVSNSHHRPKNGVTNWGGRDKDAPRGYPGWEGRVWIQYSDPFEEWGDHPLRYTYTHTGTGGGGEYRGPFKGANTFSWDYRFFLSDFPTLEKFVS